LRSRRRRFDLYEDAGEIQRLTIARSMLGDRSRDGFSESRPHGIK
jgi:hypothetical protein